MVNITADAKINADLAAMMHEANNDPARLALVNVAIDAVRTVGADSYNWVKQQFLPWVASLFEASSIDSCGFLDIDYRDRLLVRLSEVDDQATALINGERVSARSLGAAASWDRANPLPPGVHLLVVKLSNSGRGAYSCHVELVPEMLAKKGRPPKQMVRASGNDWAAQSERVYFMKIESKKMF